MKKIISLTIILVYGFSISGQTLTIDEDQSNKNSNNIRFGIDAPLFFSKSFVHVPSSLQEVITDGYGGNTYDIGLGLNIDIDEKVSLKLGVHKWNKIFNSNYKAITYDNNYNQVDLTIEENGSFNYIGLYMKLHYNIKFFFIGGGFEMSLKEEYNADYTILDLEGNIIFSEKNQSSTPLIDNYNKQVDFSIITGLRFKINENIIIKPAIEFTVPMSPITNTGAYYVSIVDNERHPIDMSAFALKFGAVIEFNF